MKWIKKHKVLTVVLAFITLLIIGVAAGGDSTKTKTTTVKTTTTTQSSQAQSAKPKWDAQAIYDQINAGMTKAQAEQIIGRTSDNCSKTSIPGYGETEDCLYDGGFGSKGSISITYQDGAVESKSKIDF